MDIIQLIQLFFLLVILKGTQSLKSLVINVPEYVKVNETVTLACEYDLEDVALYTIKWYWNEIEFYRFVPKESPPSKAFTIPHSNFNVEITRSGANEVTLRNVQKDLSGLFKCEVSADAPLFHTELKGAVMNVIDVPTGIPQMEINLKKIEIGKKIKATCEIKASFPWANLTWSINHQKVKTSNPDIKIRPTSLVGDMVSSRIEIVALKRYFHMGPMILRCDANVYSIWNSFTENFILEEVPLLAPVLLSTSSQTHDEDTFDFFGMNATSQTSFRFCYFLIVLELFTYLFIR